MNGKRGGRGRSRRGGRRGGRSGRGGRSRGGPRPGGPKAPPPLPPATIRYAICTACDEVIMLTDPPDEDVHTQCGACLTDVELGTEDLRTLDQIADELDTTDDGPDPGALGSDLGEPDDDASDDE